MIVEGHEHTKELTRSAHTVVIGSGSGGSVVAHTLAQAGVETVVLEEGGHFDRGGFTQREGEMLKKLFRNGAQQYTTDGMINVLQGSCFGGSTVINMADCEPMTESLLAHWREEFLLTSMTMDAMAPSLERVRAMLQVQQIRPDQVNLNNSLVLQGAKKLGHSTAVFEHNRKGCIGSGYCLLGCAYDAKKGAHLNYLPRAIDAGVTVYTDARVERIEVESAEKVFVHGSILERGVRIARLPFKVEAQRVVMAAGAAHSPAILWASGLGGKLPALGKNLSLQPQLGVIADYGDDTAVTMWRGIPQSAYTTAFDDISPEKGLSGYRLEGLNSGVALFAANLPGLGHPHKAQMSRLKHLSFGLVLVPDRPSGKLDWKQDSERGFATEIHYTPQTEWIERLRKGMKLAAEIHFAAGAKEVYFTAENTPLLKSADDLSKLDDFKLLTGSAHLISAHIQGTCRMGLDPKSSVVDQDHRVHGFENLYVVDASVHPTTASPHTMIPVMTLADRAARRMLDR